MRRYISVAVLCFGFALVGCNGSDDDDGDNGLPDVAPDADDVDDGDVPDSGGDAGEVGDVGDDADGRSDAGDDADAGEDTGTSQPVETVECASVTVDVTVSIFDYGYDPEAPTIAVGQVVQWTNDSALMQHTVTSGVPGGADAGDLFDSGALSSGDSFCLRFNQAASYAYFCELHPTLMEASLTVQ